MKAKEYLAEITFVALGALFILMMALGTSLIVTWGQTNQNTANIAEDRKAHDAGSADRFTRTNAERMEDRQQIKNDAMRDEILDLIKDVSYLKGQVNVE